jgi:hypothetical protein
MRARMAVATIALLVASCYNASSYEGDGRLIDHGWSDANAHYVLDLGAIDLSRVGTAAFRMHHLPELEFTVGLDVNETPHKDFSEVRPHPGNIRLTLETADHRTVISESGPMESWTWSYGLGSPRSFVYRRGAQKEVSLGQGVSRYDRIDTKSDAGWGTYFTPRSTEYYLLTVSVLEPSALPSTSTRLALSTSGWK